jgi:flagellar basal-body rod modification protein FlgD
LADATGEATGFPAAWKSGPTITGTSSLAVTSLSVVPARPGAQLTFTLSAPAHVTATVLNVAGRPIRTVVADRPLDAGLQTLLWDRRAETGLAAPSGLYLVRVTARAGDGAQSSALATLALR